MMPTLEGNEYDTHVLGIATAMIERLTQLSDEKRLEALHDIDRILEDEDDRSRQLGRHRLRAIADDYYHERNQVMRVRSSVLSLFNLNKLRDVQFSGRDGLNPSKLKELHKESIADVISSHAMATFPEETAKRKIINDPTRIEALNVFRIVSFITHSKNLREAVVKNGMVENINRIEAAFRNPQVEILDEVLNGDIRKTYNQQEATSVAQKSFAKTERRNLQMNVLELVQNNLKNNKTMSSGAKAHILLVFYSNMLSELREENTALRTFFGTPSRLEKILRTEYNKVKKIAPIDLFGRFGNQYERSEVSKYLRENPLIARMAYHAHSAYPREKDQDSLHLRESDIKQGIGRMDNHGQGPGPAGPEDAEPNTEKPKM
jgi:hypothetical protein